MKYYNNILPEVFSSDVNPVILNGGGGVSLQLGQQHMAGIPPIGRKAI